MWAPPTDTGGLAVTYIVEVLSGSASWITVNQANECAEKGPITNYYVPDANSTAAATQCTMLVSNLEGKYGLPVGTTVLARITAYHVVGSIITTITGAGTAVLPSPPCFRTTFPRMIGGSHGMTSVTAMDVDSLGNIAAGGYSQDSGLLASTQT